MKKRIFLICILAALLLTACATQTPVTLDTPAVTVDENGIATWSAIPNATGYAYQIDGIEAQTATVLFVKLDHNQSITVKALGDGSAYLDSDWSITASFQTDITEHVHSYNPQIIKPTCQSKGYTLYACDCGERYQGDETEIDKDNHIDNNEDNICDFCQAHAHRYTSVVTSPTCTQEGYTTYTCWCKYSYVAEKVPALGKHTDENNDKRCDLCSLSVIIELDFYTVNDLHGAFLDTATHPGLDEFTTYIKQKYKDTSSYEILLSAGDMWQGSVESSSNKGALMTQWMNELDFAAMTLGNHEYDWGSSCISKNAQLAEFPFLGINIRENGSQPDYCKNSVTVERGGVKIGIIGAMGNHLSSISGEFTDGLKFLTSKTLTQLVKDESTRLRQQEGCDLIVYMIHNGNTGYDSSLSDGYVDLVFEAHTHKTYINTDQYGVVHIQSGSYNEAVSFVNIAYNLANDTFEVEEKKQIYASVYGASSIADDPSVQRIFNQYFSEENPYETVLGTTSSNINSDTICQEVANQYLAFGQKHWSQYDIVLGGGYLKLRDPYRLYAGNITYAKLFSLMPFDNSLVLGKISGAKLKSKFLNGSYYVAKSDSMPNISDNKTYYIVVDTYTAFYDSNGITIVDRYDNYYARDLIADFVKKGGWNR